MYSLSISPYPIYLFILYFCLIKVRLLLNDEEIVILERLQRSTPIMVVTQLCYLVVAIVNSIESTLIIVVTQLIKLVAIVSFLGQSTHITVDSTTLGDGSVPAVNGQLISQLLLNSATW